MRHPNPLLETLSPILPAIAANARRAEEERTVPPENVALLKGIGFHRAFQPKQYGGLEISLPEFADCVATLAGACASTAWAVSLLATHSHQIALFSAQLQEEVWGSNPDATASSSIAPLGRAEAADGGVLLSGEMGWSSGCDHAEWAILGFRRPGADGSPQYCFAVVPRA
ncbi:flavin-dependent monooxygenase, partial [Pseudomonas sp. MWU13-2860]